MLTKTTVDPRPRIRGSLHADQLIVAKDVRLERDAMNDEDLLKSITSHGIRIPLIVRPEPNKEETEDGLPMFEIWDGRRRFRLGKIAGLTQFPCDIRVMSDLEAQLMAFTLNDQRQGMTVVEAGVWAKGMLKEHSALEQKELAKMMGHSDSWLSRRIAAAEQYLGTDKKDRKYLPKTERGLRELRGLSDEKQQQMLTEARDSGIAPSASDLIRASKAKMSPREVLEKWPYEDSEFLIYMLQEDAGMRLGEAGKMVQGFKLKQLPWQQKERVKFDMPKMTDQQVKLYGELARWYPIEFIDFLADNLGAPSTIETFRSKLISMARKFFEKTPEQVKQSVLEEFRR